MQPSLKTSAPSAQWSPFLAPSCKGLQQVSTRKTEHSHSEQHNVGLTLSTPVHSQTHTRTKRCISRPRHPRERKEKRKSLSCREKSASTIAAPLPRLVPMGISSAFRDGEFVTRLPSPERKRHEGNWPLTGHGHSLHVFAQVSCLLVPCN